MPLIPLLYNIFLGNTTIEPKKEPNNFNLLEIKIEEKYS